MSRLNRFKEFMLTLNDVKFTEISTQYKNQFKLRETMLNASSRNFDSIVQR